MLDPVSVSTCSENQKIYKITSLINTVNVLHLAVYCFRWFWQKAASAKSSASLNAMQMCIRIGAYRNMLNYRYANYLENFHQMPYMLNMIRFQLLWQHKYSGLSSQNTFTL